jgi:hypothetical protein
MATILKPFGQWPMIKSSKLYVQGYVQNIANGVKRHERKVVMFMKKYIMFCNPEDEAFVKKAVKMLNNEAIKEVKCSYSCPVGKSYLVDADTLSQVEKGVVFQDEQSRWTIKK